MSQDMMQTLSGSSLLSLSVGTLPAVKPGMMLDANPFASQLALMTAPETAMSVAAGAVVDGAVNTQFATALAQAVAPVAAMSADAATLVSDGAVSTDIAALPEDASPSQIIEAVLGGNIKPAPVVVQTQAKAATETPEVPSIAPDAMPEAVSADEVATGQHAKRPRHAVQLDEPVATADAATPVAAPVVEPALPAPVRPQVSAPDAGSVRVAISANPSPVANAKPAADGDTAAPAASAVMLSAQPVGVPVAPQPAAAPHFATAPAIQDSPVAGPQISTPAQPGAAKLQAPVAVAGQDATSAAAPILPVDPASATPEPVATSAIELPGQVAARSPRSATPAPRTVVSATTQRAVQAASLSARPADALGAVLGLGDSASALPAATFADATGIDAIAAKPVETVPPAWAAALNAVASPATTNAAFGLTAAPAAGTPGAGALETLAFDAGFVGNVETQIARVVGGGQMVRMQLIPENLGRIDIEMLAGPERDQVRITTEHDAVRDTLVQSQLRLEQDLRNNGNRTTDITVELRQPSTGTQGGAAQQQRGQSGSEAGTGRDGIQRQTATDALADSETAQRRPRDNVRYA